MRNRATQLKRDLEAGTERELFINRSRLYTRSGVSHDHMPKSNHRHSGIATNTDVDMLQHIHIRHN